MNGSGERSRSSTLPVATHSASSAAATSHAGTPVGSCVLSGPKITYAISAIQPKLTRPSTKSAVNRASRTVASPHLSRCLQRVWGALRFSCWLSALLHRFPEATPFERRVQQAELDHLVRSRAASTALAQSYVGLPLEI